MEKITVEALSAAGKHVLDNVERVIVGKSSAVEMVLVALFCEGHVLLEDVPGIGKTMLARAVAKSLGCTFRRVQSTPDLLPSDITGTYVYNQKTSEFEFRPGPVFTQILLADEINRATPRTQSALLEAMEEKQVTVEGDTLPLPRPFVGFAAW
jgi:MoxR-like ATPase